MTHTSLAELAGVLGEPDQPATLFRALEAATQETVGHRLFTLLFVDGNEVARVYTTDPAAYPVFGRKAMGPTPWGAHVLEGRKPYLGTDMAAIRWAFYDHELIAGLGLGSVINLPVVYDGRTIGTMNLLDVEHRYTDDHLARVAPLAPLLVPAFLLARQPA